MIQRSLGAVETFFREQIEAAQNEGAISTDASATVTAKALLGLFLGLRVLSRSCPDEKTMDVIVDQAKALLS